MSALKSKIRILLSNGRKITTFAKLKFRFIVLTGCKSLFTDKTGSPEAGSQLAAKRQQASPLWGREAAGASVVHIPQMASFPSGPSWSQQQSGLTQV